MYNHDYQKLLGKSAAALGEVQSCFCMGPQNGAPLCPCRMKDVVVRDGRYIKIERETDLGPAE